MMFKVVEFVLTNPISIFIIGMSLTVVPTLGIMYVHSTKDEKNIGH